MVLEMAKKIMMDFSPYYQIHVLLVRIQTTNCKMGKRNLFQVILRALGPFDGI